METTVKNKPNHLINEKSPYLLQHAYNPVDWYPWCEEAFEKAAREEKPVFLSIGYSTCHWCHVMAEQSFEDPETAELINNSFIPVKVDREERPDIDNIYMTVCQLMTGSGGWPLTIFLTPDKKPFYAGTYIPKESRYGRSGLLELIPRIDEMWQNERAEVTASAGKITEALKKSGEISGEEGEEVARQLPEKAYRELEREYDKQFAGFGHAPKFPLPHQLLFLLRYWNITDQEEAREMVEKTLLALRAGGIYDQLGYGFHRYSTDRRWVIPHFEKMLYDQALLAYTYLEAYQVSGEEIYSKTAVEIFSYLKQEMTDVEGGFFSAEDADSEGEEGLFYTWENGEIGKLLPGKGKAFRKSYNLSTAGNNPFAGDAEFKGRSILFLNGPGKGSRRNLTAKKLAGELREEIENYREERAVLLKERKNRIPPGKDDKILTDWNGLMIAALARGAFVLSNNEYLAEAVRAVEFILDKNYLKGQLYHRYRDGETAVTANLDDFAFLCWGLIELYEACFKPVYLERAVELNARMLEDFRDETAGGFFFTGRAIEELLTRRKEIYDGALPSGNSVALWNLVRLAHLTGEQRLLEEAGRLVRAFAGQVKENPSAYTMFLTGVMALNGPFYDLVIAADDLAQAGEMLAVLKEGYYPELTYLFRPGGKEEAAEINNLVGFLREYKPVSGKPTVYVCKNFNCQLPVTDINEMVRLLKE